MFSGMKKDTLPPLEEFFKVNGMSTNVHNKVRHSSKVKSQQEVNIQKQGNNHVKFKVTETSNVSCMIPTVSGVTMPNKDAWLSAFG